MNWIVEREREFGYLGLNKKLYSIDLRVGRQEMGFFFFNYRLNTGKMPIISCLIM